MLRMYYDFSQQSIQYNLADSKATSEKCWTLYLKKNANILRSTTVNKSSKNVAKKKNTIIK